MRKAGLCLLNFCLVLWAATGFAADTQKGPFVINEVKHMESRPLSEVATEIPYTTHFIERKEHRAPKIPFTVIPGPDPVRQNDDEFANELSITMGFNFDGMNGSQAGGVIPPDTNGAVGDKQFVLITNFAYSVYDKATGKKTLGPTYIHNIWSGFGGQCGTEDGGDPVVLYDKISKRWFVTQLEYFSSYQICMAVSKTDDATGKYNLYAFTIAGGLPDYPKYGVWPDAYYLSFNYFGAGWAEPCAVDRTKMLAGKAATMVCFGSTAPNFGLLPSDIDGSTLPASGSTNHYVELGNTNTTLSTFEFHVDFANPKKSTFKGPKTITVKKYAQLCGGGGGACIPQPSGGSALDALGNETMFRNAYRNFGDHEALVFSHSVAAGGTSKAVSAERWYELRATPPGSAFKLYQSGTYQNKTNNYWMGSIAMDKAGDIALGFSADNSTNLDPSIYFTGRVPGDPLNKMESAKLIVKGALVQSGSNRWGDYSTVSVDPVDDCTFWYTQEYGKNGGANWQSHVASFKFNSCQ